jgi:oligopeptidase B
LRTDDNLIAFRTNLDAGHAGAAGRFDRLREVALAYAFAIKVAGGSVPDRLLATADKVIE